MSVQKTTAALTSLEAANIQKLFTARADTAFEAKLNNQNTIVKIIHVILHRIFGWYGDVEGKDILEAERVSIQELKSARNRVISLLAQTSVTRPSDAAIIDCVPLEGTRQRLAAREALDKATDAYYAKLKSRVVQLTGNDLSKDETGVIARQAQFLRAGLDDLANGITKHNAASKNAAQYISPQWNTIIYNHIAQNVRVQLADQITPELVAQKGLAYVGKIVDQHVKAFGGSAQKILEDLREEVITKHGKKFDTAIKNLGLNICPKEAVKAKHDEIDAEANKAKEAVKTLSEQHQAIIKQITADNRLLAHAKTALKDREAELALFKEQLRRFPGLALPTSKDVEGFLKDVNAINIEKLKPEEIVAISNAKQCAGNILKAKEAIKILAGKIHHNIAMSDAISVRIEKAEKILKEIPARLKTEYIEDVVRGETLSKTIRLGYFVSRDAIDSTTFASLVYPPNVEKEEEVVAQPETAKKRVHFDDSTLADNHGRSLPKESYPRKQLLDTIAQETIVDNTAEGAEFSVFSDLTSGPQTNFLGSYSVAPKPAKDVYARLYPRLDEIVQEDILDLGVFDQPESLSSADSVKNSAEADILGLSVFDQYERTESDLTTEDKPEVLQSITSGPQTNFLGSYSVASKSAKGIYPRLGEIAQEDILSLSVFDQPDPVKKSPVKKPNAEENILDLSVFDQPDPVKKPPVKKPNAEKDILDLSVFDQPKPLSSIAPVKKSPVKHSNAQAAPVKNPNAHANILALFDLQGAPRPSKVIWTEAAYQAELAKKQALDTPKPVKSKVSVEKLEPLEKRFASSISEPWFDTMYPNLAKQKTQFLKAIASKK